MKVRMEAETIEVINRAAAQSGKSLDAYIIDIAFREAELILQKHAMASPTS